MSVTAPPSVPAKTYSGSVATVSPFGSTKLVGIGRERAVALGLAAELRCEPGDVLGLDAEAVAVVDGDDRRPAASAEALDRPEREAAVLARLAGADTQLAL